MNKMSEGLRNYREKVKSGEIVKKKRPSMIKAIKNKCRDCCSDYVDGKLDCEIERCSLYWWFPYGKAYKMRKGKNATNKID